MLGIVLGAKDAKPIQPSKALFSGSFIKGGDKMISKHTAERKKEEKKGKKEGKERGREEEGRNKGRKEGKTEAREIKKGGRKELGKSEPRQAVMRF